MEVLAHLSLPQTVPPSAPERLRAVHNTELDQTSRAELHQRLGVGIARVVARQPEIGVVDLYSLDSLQRQPAAPTVTRRERGRQRPDFVGSDAAGAWAIIEAKGRSAKGSLNGTRTSAVAQAKAVDLVDMLGRPIPINLRAASIARLGRPVHAFFEDPAEDGPERRTWELDPDALLVHYYQPVRDLVELYGRRLRSVSGALSYESADLPAGVLWLAAHKELLRGDLEDPDALRSIRAAIREEADAEQADSIQAGELDLAIGGDGLALVAPRVRTDLLD
jgi:hypothetical protein